MKITLTRLKQLIKEELQLLNETTYTKARIVNPMSFFVEYPPIDDGKPGTNEIKVGESYAFMTSGVQIDGRDGALVGKGYDQWPVVEGTVTAIEELSQHVDSIVINWDTMNGMITLGGTITVHETKPQMPDNKETK